MISPLVECTPLSHIFPGLHRLSSDSPSVPATTEDGDQGAGRQYSSPAGDRARMPAVATGLRARKRNIEGREMVSRHMSLGVTPRPARGVEQIMPAIENDPRGVPKILAQPASVDQQCARSSIRRTR